jgi:hypothetical protein
MYHNSQIYNSMCQMCLFEVALTAIFPPSIINTQSQDRSLSTGHIFPSKKQYSGELKKSSKRILMWYIFFSYFLLLEKNS